MSPRLITRENPNWWSSAHATRSEGSPLRHPALALWCFSLRCSSAAPALLAKLSVGRGRSIRYVRAVQWRSQRASHMTTATPESDRHSGRLIPLRQAHSRAAIARVGTERAGDITHPLRSMISSRRDPPTDQVCLVSVKPIAGGGSSARVRVLHQRSPGMLRAIPRVPAFTRFPDQAL